MHYLVLLPNTRQYHAEELAAVSWSINEMVYNSPWVSHCQSLLRGPVLASRLLFGLNESSTAGCSLCLLIQEKL